MTTRSEHYPPVRYHSEQLQRELPLEVLTQKMKEYTISTASLAGFFDFSHVFDGPLR